MWFQEDTDLAHTHVFYTYKVNRRWSTDNVDEMRSFLREFKTSVLCLFSPHCDNDLNILNFHLLYHFIDDFDRFGKVFVPTAYPYEHIN